MEVRLWPRVWLPPRSGAEDPPADVWRRAGLEREGHLGHPDRGEQRPRHLQHKGNQYLLYSWSSEVGVSWS